MLMIRLEESEYGSAWVLGDKSGLPDADGDIKGTDNAKILSGYFSGGLAGAIFTLGCHSPYSELWCTDVESSV